MPPKNVNTGRYAYEPDYAVASGRTLQETIDSLGVGRQELAVRTGLALMHVNRIIEGVAPITSEIATRLERATGVPSRMWNNLETNYRDLLTRIHD